MIEEDYVSFEVAKLLKEKGFNHWCYKSYGTAVYHKGIPISFDEECDLKSEGLEDEIEYVEGGYLYDFGCDNRKKDAKVWAAPTLQMAMKWLRETFEIHCQIDCPIAASNWVYGIRDLYKDEWVTLRNMGDYETYEEACEAAIKYVLENLI